MFRRRQREQAPPPEPDPDPRWEALVDELVRATDADEIEWARVGMVDWTWTHGETSVTVSLTGSNISLARGTTRTSAYVNRSDLAEAIRRWVDRQRDRLFAEIGRALSERHGDEPTPGFTVQR